MRRLLSRIHSYFGTNLPKRELPLNFSLPKASGKVKANYANDSDLTRDLDEAKDTPQEYFRLLMDEVKHINRCTMKPRQRLSLTREILKLYYPVALTQITKLAKTGGVPEVEDRKQLLNILVDIAQVMVVSYQILFAEYYGSSNFKYAKARNTVLECASRIFELQILKQQAKALHYQVLSDQDWQVINTVFYVMSCYENIEQPLSTLKKELEIGGKRSGVSLHDQFVQLHIVAKFDMLRWPTNLQWVIGSYLNSVERAVQVKKDDGSTKTGRNDLIAYCYGTGPASGKRLETPPGPSLILTCNGLSEAIRKDCMNLVQAKKNNAESAIPPRFAHLPETEHFVITDQLVRGLENTTADVVVEKRHEVKDLRIFVGFPEVYGLLQHRQGTYKSEERLADVLARRSALIAEDHDATDKSVWSLLFQNEKMIRLSTQETSFTKPMAIGSLFAYGLGDDINRPSLAVVSRILRPSHKVVVIDIHSIASYAEPVMITVNASEEDPNNMKKARPALLVYDKKRPGGWGLMFLPQDILLGFDQLAIHRNKQVLKINLENMHNATTDFYLFSTSLTSAQLGIEGEPDYAIPPTKKAHSDGLMI